MSKIVAVRLLWGHTRYSATPKESLISNTANSSDYLYNLKLFGSVVYINESDDPSISSIYEKVNTPETAIDPIELIEHSDTLLTPFGENYIYKNVRDPNGAVIYMKCPYTTDISSFLIDDKFTDPAEFLNWADDLSTRGLPPRTPEEVESDRLREIEEKRLADLRPPLRGSIVLVQIIDSINFNLNVVTLDLANTKVRQIRSVIAKTLKLSAFGNELASTNHFSIDKAKELAIEARKNMPTRHYAVNMFRSVMTGKKYGSGPAVGVDPNSRSTLSDNMRLSEIKGNVVVYYYNGVLRESFASQFKEMAIDALIDIVLD